MADTLEMKVIAHIRTDFPTKFGIPRQSGVVEEAMGAVIFEPEYRNPDALRGLEGFSHLWLIWQFSAAVRDTWSPTVRPPRLGGNTRMGVFATRSPFRPNAIGLSCVKLVRVVPNGPDGPAIVVSGVDLMDGTPILDIKPYLPYADSHPDARGGFTDPIARKLLRVSAPEELREKFPAGLLGVLENDPRPRYQDDPERVYGLSFGGWNVRFRVAGEELTVLAMERADGGKEQR